MLSDAVVKVNEENMKPRKLNSEGNDINRTPCVSLWIKKVSLRGALGLEMKNNHRRVP